MINILLIEDDQVDVMNVQRAFKKGKITNALYIASDGIEALEMLRSEGTTLAVVPPERRLILLDLNLPRMNGIEFLQALRADPQLRSIPVIVLTTSNSDSDRVNAYNFNIAGYLLKPIAFNTFVEAMTTLNQYWAMCVMP